jgi:hypothetical protein
MRVAVIGLVTIAAALATEIQSSSGEESFFNERFCAAGGGGGPQGNSGVPDCSFHTWQQCIESARGLGRYCTENRWWHGSREQPKTQTKNIRRYR